MTEIEFNYLPSDDLVPRICRLLNENNGEFIGSREELWVRLNLASSPKGMDQRLLRARKWLKDVGISYRPIRKTGMVVLRREGNAKQ